MSWLVNGILLNMWFLIIFHSLFSIQKQKEEERIRRQKWLSSEEYKKFVSNLEFIFQQSIEQGVDKYDPHEKVSEIIKEDKQ